MREITMYRSDSGKNFDTKAEALRDDLRHALCAAAGNDPIAKQVSDAIAEDIETFATLIIALRDEGRPRVADGAPMPVPPYCNRCERCHFGTECPPPAFD